MKLFTKTRVEKQENAKSKEHRDTVFTLLESHGIKDKRSQNECFLKMQRSGIKYFVGISKTLEPNSQDLEQFENELMEIVAKYGVTDKGDQELLITDYFIIINDLGGEAG